MLYVHIYLCIRNAATPWTSDRGNVPQTETDRMQLKMGGQMNCHKFGGLSG